MSGGGKDSTVTQKNDPPSWAVPYFQDAVQRAQSIADTPYTPYTGQLVANLTPDQLASQQMIRGMVNGPSAIGAGQDYATGLLGGGGAYGGNTQVSSGGNTNAGTNKFAGSNPYLGQMISDSSRDVTDAYSKATIPSMLSQFQQGGAFGGTAMQNSMDSAQNTLAQNLGDLSNQYRFQDYQTQQQMDEARLGRSLQGQLADAARQQAGEIASNQLGLQAWQVDQGNRMSALGMLPQLDQAQYYGAGLLGQQGLQTQGLQQTYLDALYNQFQGAQNWDVQRFTPYLQGLAAIQGGTVQSTTPNAGPSPLGGALGGAATGAAVGSAVPVIGTGIGALAGGLLGYLGSR